MDNIEKLLNELRNDKIIRETRFRSNIINTVGEIYERYGYGSAKAYLIDKQNDIKSRNEAKALLYVLNKINNMGIPSSIGSFIIRKIDKLKEVRE